MNKLTCTHCKREYEGSNIMIAEYEEKREFYENSYLRESVYLEETIGNDFCSYKCIGNWLKEREDDEC